MDMYCFGSLQDTHELTETSWRMRTKAVSGLEANREMLRRSADAIRESQILIKRVRNMRLATRPPEVGYG